MSLLSLELSPSAVARRSHGRSWFWRMLAALQASRMRRAREVIAQHRHLLPPDLELAAHKLDARNEDQLPFLRRD